MMMMMMMGSSITAVAEEVMILPRRPSLTSFVMMKRVFLSAHTEMISMMTI